VDISAGINGVGVNLPQFDGHSFYRTIVLEGVSDEKEKNVYSGV
jgi:hypothetical protein